MMKKNIIFLYLLPLTIILFCFGCTTATNNISSNSNGGCISGNCYNGNGTKLYQDGYRYVGSWKNGFRNGQGTQYFPDGSKYVGQFVNDMRNGQGIYTKYDGAVYTGQWANNQANGQGRWAWVEGEIQEGRFIDGVQVHGKVIYPTGNVYTGQFTSVDGFAERDGKGTFNWADGSKFTGDWRNNNRDKGIYTYTNGERSRQVWKGDKLISEEKIEQYRIKNQDHSTPAANSSTPQNISKPTPTPSSLPSGKRWKKAN